MRVITILLLTITTIKFFGQTDIKEAMTVWENGNINQTILAVEKILKKDQTNNDVRYLQMKAFFVQGQYQQSLEAFSLLEKSYKKYSEAADLAVKACIHLHDYENALKISEKNELPITAYLKERKSKLFTVKANKTFIVPFLEDQKLPSSFWPGVNGIINGKKASIRFDTGGNYLVIGKIAAEKYGIQLNYADKGMHGSSQVVTWHAIADSMVFENGPTFLNIPVIIMESLGDYIIFGTNILEQFLSTVDYPNERFIFTPRERPELFSDHYKLLPQNQKIVPFYLWSDHYMIAKGKFADHDSLNLFFDSGLIAITVIDGKPVQASFTSSREKLLQWGFDESKMNQATFFPTAYALEVGGLNQPNTLVWYDHNLPKDRVFGGIRIDGLISHAWLKNYTWTINFDQMNYTFGTR